MNNERLSQNFTLYEFIEAQLPAHAVKLNWQNIAEFTPKQHLYRELANDLQKIRNMINAEFRAGNGNREIGLRITSGVRCRQWELTRGRTGTNQHTVGAAADIQPVNCTQSMAIDIMYWLYTKYWPRENGWPGGFAMSKAIFTQGGIIERIGFIHFDKRPQVARWEY